jgi:hypothetical protein
MHEYNWNENAGDLELSELLHFFYILHQIEVDIVRSEESLMCA